jgi:hypothetical protein
MLEIFDDAVKKDPTISNEENKCIRKKFDEVLRRSFLKICVYNSRKLLSECKRKCKCKDPLS